MTKAAVVPDDLLAEARSLRRHLHEHPETAFDEQKTAETLQEWLEERDVETVETGLAGSGFLVRVGSGSPVRLLRVELDALPLQERSGVDHASQVDGRHHACGHDGHMAMLAGALARLAEGCDGTVYGLFQPAEEDGKGAVELVEDLDLKLEYCFAIHNVPGLPLGQIKVREGPAAVASCGLRMEFKGTSSHAGRPHQGVSPVATIAMLARDLVALPSRSIPFQESALVTVVGLEAGGEVYGTSPGQGALYLTARAGTDEHLETLLQQCEKIAEATAEMNGLEAKIERIEPFPACINDKEAVAAVHRAAEQVSLECAEADIAPWSEDFGHLLDKWPGALVLLGSGEDQPDLHQPEYDFPDDLLEKGIAFWVAIGRGA